MRYGNLTAAALSFRYIVSNPILSILSILLYGLLFIGGASIPYAALFFLLFAVFSFQIHFAKGIVSGVDIKEYAKNSRFTDLFVEHWKEAAGITVAFSILLLPMIASSAIVAYLWYEDQWLFLITSSFYMAFSFYILYFLPAAFGEAFFKKGFFASLLGFLNTFTLYGWKRYLNRWYFHQTTILFFVIVIGKMTLFAIAFAASFTLPFFLFGEYWLILYSAAMFVFCVKGSEEYIIKKMEKKKDRKCDFQSKK